MMIATDSSCIQCVDVPLKYRAYQLIMKYSGARYVETANLLGPPPPPQRLASQVRFLEVEVGIDVDDLPEIISAYPKVWNYEDVVVETTHLQRMLSKYSVCGLA